MRRTGEALEDYLYLQLRTMGCGHDRAKNWIREHQFDFVMTARTFIEGTLRGTR